MVNWAEQNVIVTGGNGFLGSHLVDKLRERGCDPVAPRSVEYDLRYYEYAEKLLAGKHVDYVFHLAANVGGIGYNQAHAYELFYDNAMMGINLIDQAIKARVGKFIQVGTVCSYPKWTPSPFRESHLWEGYPEETNAPYGLAKKMLLVQLQAAWDQYGFNGIYLMPTNLYGPRDEFNPARSHVIPALIRKFIEAENEVTVWGTGNASRDFLYVEDAVEAIILASENYERREPLNIGSGEEVRIAQLVWLLKELTGFEGKIKWDTSKPDGQPKRSLDTRIARACLSWEAQTTLRDGLQKTISWYESQQQNTPQEMAYA